MNEAPDQRNAPRDPADIRRSLLFGLALVLAFGSMYAGVLKWGTTLQYSLAGAAALVVLVALVSGSVTRR